MHTDFMHTDSMHTDFRTKIGVGDRTLARLTEEMKFLGISTRTVVIEDREITSRNEFIRLVVDLYVNRWWEGAVELLPISTEELEFISFCCSSECKSAWMGAVSAGAAPTLHRLIDDALRDYFCRQQAIARNLDTRLRYVEERLKAGDIQSVRKS